MVRIAAYIGPATPIAGLVEGGPRALVHQAADHPDGFGIAWYPLDADPEPVLTRSTHALGPASPMLEAPRRYHSACVLASAHQNGGAVAEISGIQPFRTGSMLFQHAGNLDRFDTVYRRALQARLNDQAFNAVRGTSPSELLFATWLDALGDDRGHEAMANALEKMVGAVQEIAVVHDAPATFAVIVTDGHCLITLRTATHGTPPELYTIIANDGAPIPATGRVIATEPTFQGEWSSIEPHSLVIFTVETPDLDDEIGTDPPEAASPAPNGA